MQRTRRYAVATMLAALVIAALPAAPAAAQVEGSHPVTESDYVALSAQLDKLAESSDAGDVESVVRLVPQQVYDEHPELVDIIRGAPDPMFTGSGPAIPGCPAQGRQLLAGFPAPYGHWQPNPTNNWCLPNGPNGGCGPSWIRDSGLTFDFRAACRQHDLAYQFVPTDRYLVDLQFLVDMRADCARQPSWAKPFCYGRAGLYYAAVAALGWCCYGNADKPGYNRPVPPGGMPPIQSPPCAQSTHAWVHNPLGGPSVPRGSTIYLTGVTRKFSRVRFDFTDGANNLVASHLTYFSDDGCVIRHEPEAFNTARLPVGPVTVRATFTRWEDATTVTEPVATLQIGAGGGSTTCQQYSHVWIHPGGTITRGQVIYPTGVVRRGTRITFHFHDQGGALFASHTTAAARDNCVVHHEPEAMSTAGFPLGSVAVTATFTEWESDQVVTRPVTTLTVRQPTGGGGGGGGCYPALLPEPC
jgi:hypothetical protein